MTTTSSGPARPGRSIAEVAGRAGRFTDYDVPDVGIRNLFARDSQWQAWLDVEAALATAQAQLGVIPKQAADAIVHAANVDSLDAGAVSAEIARTSHPLMGLISELARAAGPEAGEFVHWGATTQNITQTGNNLLIGRAYDVVERLLMDSLAAAADLADREAATLMAGRTHGQHAVPITLGFKVAGWLDEMVRDLARLRAAREQMATAMMGGAVGSFAAMGDAGPQTQDRVAALLGLRPMAIPSRAILDGFADHVWALAMAAATGARVARDVMTMMQTEISEVAEPAGDGSVGSSTMPQKQNPKLTYDIVELCSQIRSLVPRTLEARVHSFEADGSSTAIMDQAAADALILTGDLLVRLKMVLTGLRVNRDRLRANLDLTHGLISAEALMLALADTAGRQTAHEIVLDLTRSSSATGEPLERVAAADPRVMGALSPAAVSAILSPDAHLGASASIAEHTAQRVRNLLDQGVSRGGA